MSNVFDSLTKKKRVEIHDNQNNIIFVDATISEDHLRTSQVTMHEVEEGDQVSDHVIKKGIQLTLNGVISDDPINLTGALVGTGSGVIGSLVGGVAGAITTGALSKLGGNLLNNTSGISKTAYDAFEQIYENSIPCTIITGLSTYTNMVLESLSMPRNPGTTRSLVFTATFKQVRIVASETVEVENMESDIKDSASPTKKMGNLSTTAPGAEAQSKGSSLLYKVYEYLN